MVYAGINLPPQYLIMVIMEPKPCLACGKTLKGRVDKKFCDDYCRNTFNNQQRSRSAYGAIVRGINNCLLKNRKILATILPEEQDSIKTNREKIQQLGFRFQYFTHTYTTRQGKTYYYCYDLGYLPLENEHILVVRRKEELN